MNRRIQHFSMGLACLLLCLSPLACGKHKEEGDKHGDKHAKSKTKDNDKTGGMKAEEKPTDDKGADAGDEADAAPAAPSGPTKDEIRRARGKAPSNVAAAPADAKKTKSGIAFKILKAGTGTVKPSGDDSLQVKYSAWGTDGKRTSTTWKIKSQDPRELSFRKMIPGWKEMLGDMVVGERRLAWIPAKKAHLKKRSFKKGPRTVDFELVGLKVAPKAPKDLKRPPKDATKTASGLVYKKLKAGTGTVHPGPKADVKAKYAGWSRKGTCFDFTGPKDVQTFNLDNVIRGWTEGVQLMVTGDKYRFWIPQKIAYDGMDGRPAGQLVFDIELVEIVVPKKGKKK
ncbi:MAG: FKBP-type peptidyl-prolyl cis-trans isomerase [Myxococcales bacterium]|nr:FKBP-type peptidyl-prolyl cis-trans isomerase [Myxococcales bacterium]